MILKCIERKKIRMSNNLKSYSTSSTVDYYEKLANIGCFRYESLLINKYFPYHSSVLDIGCGVGRTTTALKKGGYRPIGIDYSSQMIKAAQVIDKEIDYKVQDVRKMLFSNETFDCAIFSFNGLMLLETYEDRENAMFEIRRVLKVGGVFIFTTPFLDNKVEKEYWKEKISHYGKTLEQFSFSERLRLGDEVTEEGNCEFHLHIPFVSEIQKMVHRCGYDILFEGRRLDYFPEEDFEDELDDNYLWVVKKRNV